MLIKEFLAFLQKHYTPETLVFCAARPLSNPEIRTIGIYAKRGRFCVDESFPEGNRWYSRHERAFSCEGSAVYDVLKDPANEAALREGGFPDYSVIYADHGPFGSIPVGFVVLLDGKWTAYVGDRDVFYPDGPFSSASEAAAAASVPSAAVIAEFLEHCKYI
ncbi:hypothetical protein SAMN02910368_01717 [Lachnospiraceae bacterium G11]|nr:hypothetical protein SAMN02910368_01717 [Lachnospiraceae bacterium G11]